MLAILLWVLGLTPPQSLSQLAKDKPKFIGNALSSGIPIYTNYSNYWNQVTPGNAGKWGSVEGFRNSYNWIPLDDIYNYSITNGFRYKHHTLVWGQQEPLWVAGLDSASQRVEVEEWIRLVGEKYTSASFVDVVNEPFHAPPSYMNALGGSGKTGWDWVITAFAWARQYCIRGTKLILNEYNVLQDNLVTDNFIRLIDTLRVRNLIDAIGIQGHYFEFKSAAGMTPAYAYPIGTLKANLDKLAATGLPIYISEFDINEPDDAIQLQNYQTYFPMFWEHPGVVGITLWGYVQGDMWKVNAYLVRSDGSERPALQWLRRYVTIPLPPVLVSPVGTNGEPRNPRLVWRPSATASSYRLRVSTSGGFSPIVVDTVLADTICQVNPLAANARYYWQVNASNDSGTSAYSASGIFMTGDQILAVQGDPGTPAEFRLFQNYPNPFNPSSTITYEVPHNMHVKISLYDPLGREVATLVNDNRPAGRHSVTIDAGNLPSGAYLYRMTAGGYGSVRKLLVVK